MSDEEILKALETEPNQEALLMLLEASEEVKTKLRVFSFLSVVIDGIMSRERALKQYQLTEQDVQKYEADLQCMWGDDLPG